jgi:protein-L-isoaspartate(D-aspartate) O-methyltransferase
MPILPPDPLAGWFAGALAAVAAAATRWGSEHDDASYARERERMVTDQLAARDIRHPAVLAAMRQVPRHRFVPDQLRPRAYQDHPLVIGHGQTISQPYIVALMTELARPTPTDRALEIGTGCGYQAAVLSRLVRHVYSVEIVDALRQEALDRLAALGYDNVTTRRADGYAGWASEAPFGIILVTAAPEVVPPALLDQLAPGGRLVIPVGPLHSQQLRVIEKGVDGSTRDRAVAPVLFVPMVRQESEDGR